MAGSALVVAGVQVWSGVVIERPEGPEGPEPPDPADLALLSPAERERVRRLVFDRDRVRYAGAHAGVRRALGDHLGVPPESVGIGRAPCPACGDPAHGPPRVATPVPLYLSLSRSGGRWLCAASPDHPVGVDLETERAVDLTGLPRLVLSERERAYLTGQPEPAALGVFYRCWTRKEAVLKAVGVGLAADLTGLDVYPDRGGPVAVRYGLDASAAGRAAGWLVHDLPVEPGLVAALAVPTTSPGNTR